MNDSKSIFNFDKRQRELMIIRKNYLKKVGEKKVKTKIAVISILLALVALFLFGCWKSPLNVLQETAILPPKLVERTGQYLSSSQDLPLIKASLTANQLASAILTPETTFLLKSASMTGPADQFEIYSYFPLQGFPTDGYSYAVISNGYASGIAGVATDFYSYGTGGPSSPPYSHRGLNSYDIATLSLTLFVPAGANTLSFDWKFATEENPTFVGSFVDWARATIITSDGEMNVLLLPDGKPVDVDNAIPFSNAVSGSSTDPLPPYPSPNDTVYNAVTGMYTSTFDVTSLVGETITIDFQVGDENDAVLDSALFVDNLKLKSPIGDLPEETISNYYQSADRDGDGYPDFGWNSRYNIVFVDQTLQIELNIKLVGDDPGASIKQQWEEGIEGIWSNQYDIVDGYYRYPIVVELNWVDSNYHHEVTVHNTWGRDNMLNWYTNPFWGWWYRDEIAAHEAGHMLGLYDEYLDDGVIDENDGALDPATLFTTTNSIMADLGPPRDWHYEQILEWLETGSDTDLSLANSPLPPYPLDDPIPDFSDPMILDVSIDIKPGSWPNAINTNSKGVIPVAVLTTSTMDGDSVNFDATLVDVLSVRFGPNEATAVRGKGHIEDVDGDGDLDMVFQFKIKDTGIQPGETEACLTGKDINGQDIKGIDAIMTLPN